METKQAIISETIIPTKQINVNGTNLSYIEQGAGETVVFIHGAVSDLRTWHEQFDEFSKNYRAVSYSRRFHQPNEQNNGDSIYARASHTADLLEFLGKLNIEKAHLVGHSYGASIALMAALEEPEMVGSLVLGEPSPFPALLNDEGKSLLSKQKAGFNKAMRLARIGEREAAVREFLHTVVGVDVLCLLPEERRDVVLENADTLLPMLETYYDSPAISFDQLRALKIPTLIITGELSPRISRLNDETINRCLPNSRVKILKGASHGLQIENAEGFNKLVFDFLESTKNLNKQVQKQALYEPVLY